MILRMCIECAQSILDGALPELDLPRLQQAAARSARSGRSLEEVHHTVCRGFLLGIASTDHLPAAEDAFESLRRTTRTLLEALGTISATLSRSYLSELQAIVDEQRSSALTLAATLLAGRRTSAVAREIGIDLTAGYTVLSLMTVPDSDGPESPGHHRPGTYAVRVRDILDELYDATALSQVSDNGGTIVLPENAARDHPPQELIARLSDALGIPVLAAAVTGSGPGIPAVAEQARDLLDMVYRLGYRQGLHRFADLALEFQLTRRGPARQSLGALLDPLDAHPELLRTLECHIATEFNRRRTARALHVHTNTVDYRLQRIAKLTGLDPAEAAGFCRLRSAVLTRSYLRSETRNPVPPLREAIPIGPGAVR
ncbi:PucR family transcriptional regulator [Nocardia sp. CA-290969]|uniref:PucR family transcriptional regulator n=1 Tax=Nocardia sp. CA-290969 TaxID=3239986 RepID=UPI003D90648E